MTDGSHGWLKEILHFSSDRSLTVLLYALLLLIFVVDPFLSDTALGRIVIDGFFVLILFSGALAVRRFRRLSLVAALFILLGRLFVYIEPTRSVVLIGTTLAVLYLIFACMGILRQVFARGRITRSRIEGAIAVYLLLGLTFGLVYALIFLVEPTAFDMSALDLDIDPRSRFDRVLGQFSYFSFITLTTVGFGDITPLSGLAKQFAVLEGLIGQLYPAILLARLVSMELAQSVRAPTEGDEEP